MLATLHMVTFTFLRAMSNDYMSLSLSAGPVLTSPCTSCPAIPMRVFSYGPVSATLKFLNTEVTAVPSMAATHASRTLFRWLLPATHPPATTIYSIQGPPQMDIVSAIPETTALLRISLQ